MKKTLSLRVKEQFKSKKECLAEADRILEEGLLDNMSRTEIAREIYCHALVYRFCARTGMFSLLKNRADPIDMVDTGDLLLKRIFYRLTWMFTPKDKE